VQIGVVEGSERDRGADLAGKVDARRNLAPDEVGQSDHTVGLTQEMALQMEREVEPVAWVDLGVMRNDGDGDTHAAQPPHEEDVPIAHHGDDRGIGPLRFEPLHDRAQDPANVESARHELPRVGVGAERKVDRGGERPVLKQLGAFCERQQRLSSTDV
jgi:hypothetical protein